MSMIETGTWRVGHRLDFHRPVQAMADWADDLSMTCNMTPVHLRGCPSARGPKRGPEENAVDRAPWSAEVACGGRGRVLPR